MGFDLSAPCGISRSDFLSPRSWMYEAKESPENLPFCHPSGPEVPSLSAFSSPPSRVVLCMFNICNVQDFYLYLAERIGKTPSIPSSGGSLIFNDCITFHLVTIPKSLDKMFPFKHEALWWVKSISQEWNTIGEKSRDTLDAHKFDRHSNSQKRQRES